MTNATETGSTVRDFVALLFWIGFGLCFTPYFPAGASMAVIFGLIWLFAPAPNAVAKAAEDKAKDNGGGGGWIAGLVLVMITIAVIGALMAVAVIDETCGLADPAYVTCSR